MNESTEQLIDKLREETDSLREKYAENPALMDNFSDESDDFLSPEVGQILADWRTGNFDFRSLYKLSTENRQAFFQHVKETWGVTIKVEPEGHDAERMAE